MKSIKFVYKIIRNYRKQNKFMKLKYMVNTSLRLDIHKYSINNYHAIKIDNRT